jgi:predicted outer membrane repeat protein
VAEDKDCGQLADGCGAMLDCGSCSGSTPICISNVCTACTSHTQCGAGNICVDGSCQECDVTCGAANHICAGTDLQTALTAGGTVTVCPGQYTGSFLIPRDGTVTVIGAGQGDDPAVDTILDGQNAARVAFLSDQSTGMFRRVRITRGLVCAGGGIFTDTNSTLNMEQCTISRNSAINCSGGGIYARGNINLTDCEVSLNSTNGEGGGIVLYGGTSSTLDGVVVRKNTASPNAGISVVTGTVNLINGCLVTENEAISGGGGLNVVSGTSATISDDSLIVDNDPVDCAGSGTINGICGPKP